MRSSLTREVLGRFAASSSENLKWVREERLFSDVVEWGKRRYLVLKTIGIRKGAFGQFQKRKVKDRAVVDSIITRNLHNKSDSRG